MLFLFLLLTLLAFVPLWQSPSLSTSPVLGSMMRMDLSLDVVASREPVLQKRLQSWQKVD